MKTQPVKLLWPWLKKMWLFQMLKIEDCSWDLSKKFVRHHFEVLKKFGYVLVWSFTFELKTLRCNKKNLKSLDVKLEGNIIKTLNIYLKLYYYFNCSVFVWRECARQFCEEWAVCVRVGKYQVCSVGKIATHQNLMISIVFIVFSSKNHDFLQKNLWTDFLISLLNSKTNLGVIWCMVEINLFLFSCQSVRVWVWQKNKKAHVQCGSAQDEKLLCAECGGVPRSRDKYFFLFAPRLAGKVLDFSL